MDKKKEPSDKHLERSKPYFMENKIMDTDISSGSNPLCQDRCRLHKIT